MATATEEDLESDLIPFRLPIRTGSIPLDRSSNPKPDVEQSLQFQAAQATSSQPASTAYEAQPPAYSKKDPTLPRYDIGVKISPEEARLRSTRFLECLRPLTIYLEFDEAEGCDPFEAQAKQVDNPAPGTCQWIYRREMFKDWRSRRRSNVLLVLALPGSGKSVLAKSLYETLSGSSEDSFCFFCNRSFSSRNTVRSIVASFIYMLVERYPLLGRMLPKSLLRENLPFKTLWDLFLDLSGQDGLSNYVFIIDALDECTYESQDQFRDALIESENRLGFRICITARPESIPRALGRRMGAVIADKEVISEDIRIYLNSEFEREEELFSGETVSHVRAQLEEGAEGMFLFTFFQLQKYRIASKAPEFSTTPNAIRDFFNSEYPGQFKDYYGVMLDSVLNLNEDAGEKAATILSILLVAQDSLDEGDLAAVLAFAFHEFSTFEESTNFTEGRIFWVAQQLCGSLVKVKEDKISIVHPSAREYLLNSQQAGEHEGRRDFLARLDLAAGHVLMTRACLRFLSLPDVELRERSDFVKFPLLLYSLFNWSAHVRGCGENVELCKDVLEAFFKPGSEAVGRWSLFVKWIKNECKPVERGDPPSSLSIIVQEDLMNLLEFVTKAPGEEQKCYVFGHAIDIDARDSTRGESSLYTAVTKDNTKLVQKILDLGPSIDLPNKYGYAPLHAAVALNSEKLVDILLSAGANPDAEYLEEKDDTEPDSPGPALVVAFGVERMHLFHLLLSKGAKNMTTRLTKWSVLHEAASRGDLKSIEALFEYGLVSNVNAQDNQGWTALEIAAGKGDSMDIVRYLWGKGADLNSGSPISGSALDQASQEGNQEIVRFLLENDAQVEKGSAGWTPLLTASSSGHIECVKLLLEYNADTRAVLKEGQDALSVATCNGHKEIVELLLDHDVDVNARDKNGRTALLAATCGESSEIVKILLASKAETEYGYHDSNITALHMAAFRGNTTMVKLLISHKALLEAKTIMVSWTPLLTALSQGKVEAARLLLEAGSECDVIDNDGNNGLLMACANTKDVELLEMIIARTADVTKSNNIGSTALHLAAINCFESGVKTLLKTQKFETLVRNDFGSSPLYMAAEGGSSTIVDCLLEYDYDADARTNQGWTALHASALLCNKATVTKLMLVSTWTWRDRNANSPLHLAVYHKNYQAIEALLQGGMSINTTNDSGWTPLHDAIECGDEKMVLFLLDRGADRESVASDNISPYTLALMNSNESLADLVFPRERSTIRTRRYNLTNPVSCAAAVSINSMRKLRDFVRMPIAARNSNGYTPLHEAADTGDLEGASYLLEQDSSNLNGQSHFNQVSPLLVAAREDFEDCASLLLAKGANWKLEDVWGFTAVYYAARYEPLLEVLLDVAGDLWDDFSAQVKDRGPKITHQVCVVLRKLRQFLTVTYDEESAAQSRKQVETWLVPEMSPDKTQSLATIPQPNTTGVMTSEPIEVDELDRYGATAYRDQPSNQPTEAALQDSNESERQIDDPFLPRQKVETTSQTIATNSKAESTVTSRVPNSMKNRLQDDPGAAASHDSGSGSVAEETEEIISVIDSEEAYRASDRNQYYCLLYEGLIHLGDEDGAQTAVEALIGPPASTMRNTITCTRCRKAKSERCFLCKTCPSRFLCKDCKDHVTENGYRGCTEHRYVQVPRESWFSRSAESFDDAGNSEEEWLVAMEKKYLKKKKAYPNIADKVPTITLDYETDRSSVFTYCDTWDLDSLKQHILRWPRDISNREKDGKTLVDLFIERGTTDTNTLNFIEYLTFAGAPIFTASKDGASAVSRAVKKKFEKCTTFLLSNFDSNFDKTNSLGPLLLRTMIKRGWSDSIKYAIERHYAWVAAKDFEWINGLSRTSITDQQIVAALVDLKVQHPWVDFDPPKSGRQPNASWHRRACLHESRPLSNYQADCQVFADEDTSDVVSEKSSDSSAVSQPEPLSLFDKTAALCGIGGVFASGRGHASFADDELSVTLSYRAQRQADSWEPFSILVEAGAGLLEAMAEAQDQYRCCSSTSVAHHTNYESRGEKRSAVALTPIPFDKVTRFVNSVREMRSPSRLVGSDSLARASSCATEIFQKCDFSLQEPESDDFAAQLDYCSLAMQFLSLGFLSFCAGHQSQMHIPILRERISKFTLTGCESRNILVMAPQKMACVGEMLNDDMLTFSSNVRAKGHPVDENDIYSNPLNLIARPIDVLELYGPGDFIFPKQEKTDFAATLELCGGHITVTDELDDMHLAHWQDGLCDLRRPLKQFDIRAPMCIGALNRNQNHAVVDLDESLKKIIGKQVHLGPESEWYKVGEYREKSIQAGQYIAVGAVEGSTAQAEKDQKQDLLNIWNNLRAVSLGELEKPWGLIVSPCTGVAQRVALRVVVSMALEPYLETVDFDDEDESQFTATEREAFEKELMGYLGDTAPLRPFFRRQKNIALKRHARAVISDILYILKDSGVSQQGKSFRIACPRAHDLKFGIEFPCSGGKDEWARVLQDSSRCATFAIFTKQCLETSWVRCRLHRTKLHWPLQLFLTEVLLERTATGAVIAEWSIQPSDVYYIRKKGRIARGNNFGGQIRRRAGSNPNANVDNVDVLEIWNVGPSNVWHGKLRNTLATNLEPRKFLEEKRISRSSLGAKTLIICAET